MAKDALDALDPETLSRCENDKQRMGDSTERLLRLLAVTGAPKDRHDRPDGEIRLAQKNKRWVNAG